MARLLMHKDRIVARFECSNFYVKKIEIINGMLMPFIVTDNEKANNASFLDWKKSRPRPCSPQNFTNPLLSQIAPTYEDISEYICASLTDCYWFKPEDLNISWDDINYFKNKIIDDGNFLNIEDKFHKYTDSSNYLKEIFKNNKSYRKFIKYFTIDTNGNYCLVKTCDVCNNGLDVFNEVIGNVLEEALDIDGAQYFIHPYNFECENNVFNIPLAVCNLFIQDDTTEMVTLSTLKKLGDLSDFNTYEYLVSLGFKEQINKMLVLDYILLNPDRTFDDIAIIRDSETLAFKKLAPIYDCGAAFNYYNSQDISDDTDYSLPFLKRHSRQIELVDDFSFVDFEALDEAIETVDALISYSALSIEMKERILNILKSRIKSLKDIILSKEGTSSNSIRLVRAADKINKRFDVEAIIKFTGIDPIISQDPKNLFINYLSLNGKKEFANFQTNNPNLKERFDNFKKDTLCLI